MKRSRNINPPGSMDMLLDAMCNVFGAVLFVAILLGGSSAAHKLTRRAGTVEKTEYDQVISQLKVADDQLKAVNMQYDILSKLQDTPPQDLPQVDHQLQQQYGQQVKRANQLAGELETMQRELNVLRTQLALMQQYGSDPAAWRQALSSEEEALQKDTQQSSHALKLPESSHVVDKEPWWMLITADEIFVVGSSSQVRSGRSLRPGVTIKFFTQNGTDYFQLIKQPGAGIKLSEFDFSKMAMPTDGEREFFPGLLCEPDAVAHCALLIRQLRQAGIVYLWRIVPHESALLRSAAEETGYDVAR